MGHPHEQEYDREQDTAEHEQQQQDTQQDTAEPDTRILTQPEWETVSCEASPMIHASEANQLDEESPQIKEISQTLCPLEVSHTQIDDSFPSLAKSENGSLLTTAPTSTSIPPTPLVVHPGEDVDQGSSSEPTWGRYRQQTQQEMDSERKVWEQTNQHETAPTYRHCRCALCDKPVSARHLNTGYILICVACTHKRDHVEDNERPSDKRGGRRDKDDEEEWGSIPIPQSDDSDDEYWLEELTSTESESEQEEEDVSRQSLRKRVATPNNEIRDRVNNTNDLAFLIGPRRDGIIRQRNGKLLTILALSPVNPTYSISRSMSDSPQQSDATAIQSWTGHLLHFQLLNLKMCQRSRYRLPHPRLAKYCNGTSSLINYITGIRSSTTHDKCSIYTTSCIYTIPVQVCPRHCSTG